MPDGNPDAIVVGSGPNGLAAAIAIAREGHSVRVLEAEPTPGGGTRSAELTLPGFVHDVCSAIHPLAVASPFMRELPLAEHGLELIHPGVPLAHPLPDGSAAVLERSPEAMDTLGPDARAWSRLMGPLARGADGLLGDLLGPLRPPRHPVITTRFGLRAIRSAKGLAEGLFDGEAARALFGGLAAHSMLPLEKSPSAAFGLMLGATAHAVGWPMAAGGSQKIADAMVAHLRTLGGTVETERRVGSLDELPPARAVLLDVTPRQLLAIAGERLPGWYARLLRRYRYGPGVFKLDWALDGPIPWSAEACRRAGTVHVGGTLPELVKSEAAVTRGQVPERPYVLLAQQTPFDPSRAPEGKHTAWAYCHVPSGCPEDMTERIEAQIERFAPGFRELVIGRSAMAPADVERHNSNYIGGDINGGVQDLFQLFTRPVPRLTPYIIPARGLYICSSSTPPGGGVHGMCGYHAARAALRKSF
ncbi:MAG TPA: NAD(P)/FAD-dependent oxidoreductase [Thermoleophilaceae bacterium]|nr:NAD(P)/FAD-dependent oxidoreductase [Thermoleophilaceae bacterium]